MMGTARPGRWTLAAWCVSAAVGHVALAGPPEPPAGASASGQVILDDTSYWRAHYTWTTPVVRSGDTLAESRVREFLCRTEPPPAGWTAPDFDDSAWSRWRIGTKRRREFDYGFKVFGPWSPSLALHCLRGRFRVDDPDRVQGLMLSLTYRGGVVAYLNGTEIGRGHLRPAAPSGRTAWPTTTPRRRFCAPTGGASAPSSATPPGTRTGSKAASGRLHPSPSPRRSCGRA